MIIIITTMIINENNNNDNNNNNNSLSLLTLAEAVPIVFSPCMDLAVGILATGTPGVVAFLIPLVFTPTDVMSDSERAARLDTGPAGVV